MKNRKTIIVAFLLVAALCLGIGYAALTDTLNINGTANISKSAAETEFDEDVYFTSASGNGCSAAIADGNKPDAATLTITDGIGVLGDYVTATYTVQNEGEKPVTVSIAHNSSTNFDISYNINKNINIYSEFSAFEINNKKEKSFNIGILIKN